MNTIGASAFRDQCLALLDNLPPDGLVVTKRGKPVARVVPCSESPKPLIGCLRGKIRVTGDIRTTSAAWPAGE